ncbi:MAG: hypothetical protein Q9195_006600 [Heterodermia aff. obscurata]
MDAGPSTGEKAVDTKPSSTVSFQAQNTNGPLTQDEKKWLKDNYGGEFHFLRGQGLSIYKEEDREEGRIILRAMMQEDDDGEDDEDDGDTFLRELEQDPTSHVADYHFSAEELEWIKKNYGHSGNFLFSYGLKPFEDDDCQEGKSIILALMEDE